MMQAKPTVGQEAEVIAPPVDPVAAGAAAYAYTIPGLQPGDPPILITFRRNPADVVRDMAREIRSLQRTSARQEHRKDAVVVSHGSAGSVFPADQSQAISKSG